MNIYLKLAKENISKVPLMIKAQINNQLNKLDLLSEQKKAVIDSRIELCKSCEHSSENKPTELRNPLYINRIDWHCDLCGCMLFTKTACLDNTDSCECPIKKWLRYNEENNG